MLRYLLLLLIVICGSVLNTFCALLGGKWGFYPAFSSENIIGHNNIIIHWKTLVLNNVLKYPWTILQLSPAYENKYNLLLGFLLLTSS